MSDAPLPRSRLDAGLDRLTRAVAIVGGLLCVGAAVLVTVSITRRWLGFGPISGDFELVQMAIAVSIFSFLPLTQARRGNIMVDTFTNRLPPRVNGTIDALWDFVLAAFMALLAWCLMNGARDAFASGLNSMVLGFPLAPVFTICVALAAFLAGVAVVTGLKLLRNRP